jgi:hypothetical protein
MLLTHLKGAPASGQLAFVPVERLQQASGRKMETNMRGIQLIGLKKGGPDS